MAELWNQPRTQGHGGCRVSFCVHISDHPVGTALPGPLRALTRLKAEETGWGWQAPEGDPDLRITAPLPKTRCAKKPYTYQRRAALWLGLCLRRGCASRRPAGGQWGRCRRPDLGGWQGPKSHRYLKGACAAFSCSPPALRKGCQPPSNLTPLGESVIATEATSKQEGPLGAPWDPEGTGDVGRSSACSRRGPHPSQVSGK